jgi:predicted sulfurtransferase
VKFVNTAGVALDETADEQSLEEFRRTAVRVRDAVAAWRLVQSEPSLTGEEVAAREFGRTAANGSLAAAAEFLNLTLLLALRSFAPLVWLAHVSPENAAALREAAGVRDVALLPLCCLQLHNHIVGGVEYRRCANEACGRLFAASEGRRQALYCSASCRHAQAQREFRRRRREAE